MRGDKAETAETNASACFNPHPYVRGDLSEAAEGITAAEIEDAKARKYYLEGAANVWHKDRTGFYI